MYSRGKGVCSYILSRELIMKLIHLRITLFFLESLGVRDVMKDIVHKVGADLEILHDLRDCV